jgi:hypothetical protein
VTLSRRCSDFLATHYISAEIRGISKVGGAIDADIESAERGNAGGVIRGAVVPVYGGDLYGWCCIGTRRPVARLASDGLTLVKVAEHAEAQCAIVMSADGRIGVSWSGEFLPRYSHMTHFLEATAAWSGVLGWRYADVVQSELEPVFRVIPRCELIPEASGEYVRWWANEEYAVYGEPRLADPAVSPALRVTVMARTESQAQALSRRLRDEVPGKRPEFFLKSDPVIGDGYPELPGIWGSLTPASVVIDGIKDRLA